MKLRRDRGHSLALGRRAVVGGPFDLQGNRGQGLTSLIMQGPTDAQPLSLLSSEGGARAGPSLLG